MLPETKYVTSGGDHIAYQVLGDGPPDIVLVSGWFSHVDGRWEEPSYAAFLHRVASFGRLIHFDKRGTGASDPLPTETSPTWEEWADDVRVVMDAVGSERAAMLGISDGGPMATLFAALYPDRCSALVLLNTWAKMPRSKNYPIGMEPDVVDEFLRDISDSWGRGGSLDWSAPSKRGDAAFQYWFSKYQRLSSAPGPAAAGAKQMVELDVRSVLPTIHTPTLVVQRTEQAQRYFPPEVGHYLAQHIPGAKLVEFPGRDHMVYLGNQVPILSAIEEFLTGDTPHLEADRILATVLFTDIVGSTDRAVAMGDRRWKELLDTHDAIVRQQVERFRGRIIDFAGDGTLSTFDGPGRAIQCALALRDALGAMGLDIRAGVHTGEVERLGNSVVGMAVHLGARVMAEAGPREVLVSSTVRDLVVGSGIAFSDVGVRALRGIPGEWRLFAAQRS